MVRSNIMLYACGWLLLAFQALAQVNPVIVSTVPKNGATNVPAGNAVILTFSVPMNTAVTTAQFFNSSVPPPNSLSVTRSWNVEGTRMTNTPSAPFPSGKAITWLATGMDLQGHPLGMPFSGAFLTATGSGPVPELISVVPDNRAVDVPTNTAVVFTFSVAMNTNRTVAQFQNVLEPSQPISVTATWDKTHTVLTYTPLPALPAGKLIVWTLQGEGAEGGAFTGGGGSFTTLGDGGIPNVGFSALLSSGETATQVDAGFPTASGLEFLALSGDAVSGSIRVVTPASETNFLAALPEAAGVQYLSRTTDPKLFGASHPPGRYQFRVGTTNGVSQAALDLNDGPLPGMPQVVLTQGTPRVVVGQSLALQWTLNPGGATTEHLRVQIRQGGRVIFASPLPDSPGALNGASNRIVVPASVFNQVETAEVSLSAFHFTAVETNSIPGLTLHAARHRTTSYTLRVVDGSTPPPNLRFAQFPGIPVGEPVMYALTATNGVRPILFEQISGTLPPGLTFGADGSLTGQASQLGTFDATIRLTDLLGQSRTSSVRMMTIPLPTIPTPHFENVRFDGVDRLRFDLVGGAGLDCRVERSSTLLSWTTLFVTNPPVDRMTLEIPITDDKAFFRVPGPGAPLPANPLVVTPVLSSKLSNSAPISLFGGTLSLTNTTGYVFTLHVPPGALDRTETITLTEVIRMDGIPLVGGLRAAVDLSPPGLLFNTPVRLEIVAPTLVDPAAVIGFQAVGDGREFGLYPYTASDRVAAFQMLYLTLTGIGQGTLAEVQAQLHHRLDDPHLNTSQEVAAIRFACALGNCESLSAGQRSWTGAPGHQSGRHDPATDNALILQKYIDTARSVVIPQLKTAADSSDDSTLDNALLGWRRWLAEMQTLGIAGDLTGQDQEGPLAQCLETAAGLAARGIWNGMTRACQECLDHDLARIGRVESLARTALSLGWSYDTYFFECAKRCLVFELSIESKMIQSGTKGTYKTETKSKVELTPWEGDWFNLLFGGGYEGEGTWEVKNVEDFDTPCPVTNAPKNGQAKVPLARLKLFQPRCDYVPGKGLVLDNKYYPELRVYLLANKKLMPGEGRVSRCPKDDPMNVPDVFGPSFVAIHNNTAEVPEAIGEPCIRLEGFEQMSSGETLFKKVYVETMLVKDGYVEERTTVELHHKPN